jgi:hypothetical protein
MLARTAATKISSGDQDRCPGESGVIQGKALRSTIFIETHVIKQELAQTFKGNALQVSGRDYPVRIHIIPGRGDTSAGHFQNLF